MPWTRPFFIAIALGFVATAALPTQSWARHLPTSGQQRYEPLPRQLQFASQRRRSAPPGWPLLALTPGGSSSECCQPGIHYDDDAATKREVQAIWLTTSITAAITGAIMAGGFLAWWRDSGTTGWNWQHGGGFERNTFAGGLDKVGHFYTWYLSTRALTQIYAWTGVRKEIGVWIASGAAFTLGNIVEVVDGFTPFGFEYGDAIANTLGIGLAITLEHFPMLDQLVGVRAGYVPSPQFVREKKSYFKLINDYDGMLFHLDFKFAGLRQFGWRVGPLRYALLGLIYGTGGYQPVGDAKSRNIGLSMGVNVPEVLGRLFGEKHWGVRAAQATTRYYALPFLDIGWIRDLNSGRDAISFGVANRF